MRNLSQREYAAHRGTLGLPGSSVQAVSEALKAGRIHKNSAGKIDSEQADRDWEANTDPSKVRESEPSKKRAGNRVERPAPVEAEPKGGSPLGADDTSEPRVSPDDDSMSFQQAKRLREITRMRRERFELAVQESRYVELAPINAWAAGMIVKAQSLLGRTGKELQDRVAQEADPVVCGQMIQEYVDAALANLCQYRPPEKADA